MHDLFVFQSGHRNIHQWRSLWGELMQMCLQNKLLLNCIIIYPIIFVSVFYSGHIACVTTVLLLFMDSLAQLWQIGRARITASVRIMFENDHQFPSKYPWNEESIRPFIPKRCFGPEFNLYQQDFRWVPCPGRLPSLQWLLLKNAF